MHLSGHVLSKLLATLSTLERFFSGVRQLVPGKSLCPLKRQRALVARVLLLAVHSHVAVVVGLGLAGLATDLADERAFRVRELVLA